MNIAIAEIEVLAERQINRLLDPHLNSRLPHFLAHGESGLGCGFEGGQYLATSIAAENLDLAAPASIKSIPSNGSNQDVVSMGLTSARRSLQLTENVTTILTVLIAACHQASFFLPTQMLSGPIDRLNEHLTGVAPQYDDAIVFSDFCRPVRAFLTRTE